MVGKEFLNWSVNVISMNTPLNISMTPTAFAAPVGTNWGRKARKKIESLGRDESLEVLRAIKIKKTDVAWILKEWQIKERRAEDNLNTLPSEGNPLIKFLTISLSSCSMHNVCVDYKLFKLMTILCFQTAS